MATGTINSGAAPPLPPNIVGDNFLQLANRASYIYRLSNFTSQTAPVYNHPQGAIADAIQVKSLQTTGTLLFNGIAVIVGDIVTNTDMNNNGLVFIPLDQDPIATSSWDFTVRGDNGGGFSIPPIQGTITMQNAEANVTPPLPSITLGFDPSSAPIACNLTATVLVYITQGTNFLSTTVIWTNSNGTGIPAAGEYSDGTYHRVWDGISSFGPPIICAGVALSLGTDPTNAQDACIDAPSTYYSTSTDFLNIDFLYTDINLTFLATAGWYSNTFISKHWNGNNFIDAVPCNQGNYFPLMGYDIQSGQDACLPEQTIAVYLDTLTLYTNVNGIYITTIWNEITLQTPAVAGWYSDGTVLGGSAKAFYWDGYSLTQWSPCIAP